MSFWKVAAAQYEPRKTSLTEQVAHHLEFVRAAARQQCQLLVFPSLSLLGVIIRDVPFLPHPISRY